MLKFVPAVFAIGLLAGVPGQAIAQSSGTPAQAPAQSAESKRMSEVVCQKQEVIGSRLAVKRVCKTRAEWADAQLQDRQVIEKVQTERSMPGN